MGLDMYLYLKRHESILRCDNMDTTNFYPPELADFQVDIWERNFLSKETLHQVGYWRKFNALHSWIVKNCADGEDNCKPIYIDGDKLDTLISVVKKVSNNHDLAKRLLPTQNGLFFGGTEYDKWYFYDLDYTYRLLTNVRTFLDNFSNYDLVYEASW